MANTRRVEIERDFEIESEMKTRKTSKFLAPHPAELEDGQCLPPFPFPRAFRESGNTAIDPPPWYVKTLFLKKQEKEPRKLFHTFIFGKKRGFYSVRIFLPRNVSKQIVEIETPSRSSRPDLVTEKRFRLPSLLVCLMES